MAVINLLELKRLATTRSFARGEAYFKDGRVHDLEAHEGNLHRDREQPRRLFGDTQFNRARD